MKENIGNRIKRYRLAAKLTQQQVADALKISRVAVSKWESGQTKDLKKDNLIGLTKLFHCSLEELLTGSDYIEGECRRIDENVLEGPSI